MSQELAMLATLDQLAINWTMVEHEAVFTVEASAQLHHDIAGAHTKNLFLKDAAGQYWLVTAPHDARIDIKAMASVIGAKKLSFGKADDMERLLGVAPGSVTPLAGFNDRNNRVKIVIDSRLATAACVNVHPLRNTATIGISGEGLISFLRNAGHAVAVVELPEPQ